MKIFVIIQIIVFSLVSFIAKAQNNDKNSFYYYKGEKKELTPNINVKSFIFNEINDLERLNELPPNYTIIAKGDFPTILEANIINTINPNHTWVLIYSESGEWTNTILQSSLASYPGYIDKNGGNFGISSIFSVKLKKEGDYHILEELATQNGAIIINQDKYMPKWYTLYCLPINNKSPLELVNFFQESSLFVYSEPEFIHRSLIDCVNDPDFGSQYGLHNTNACGGWNITMGTSNITVAIIDMGIDIVHPELSNNIISPSYHTQNGTFTNNSYYKAIDANNMYYSHGTRVAGVCAAENNSYKIIGLSPNSKLMNITDPLSSNNGTNSQTLANGINYAWQNGADIINGSWHWNASSKVDDAIGDALTMGRNGLGCIFVFAAGNTGSDPVNYPAITYHDAVIAVGGTMSNNNIMSISSYGEDLDIMAPGHEILLTDFGDYLATSSGTSYSSPLVAGLAALILSLDPCLTAMEVKEIICKSAQKVSSTPYALVKEFGTWNQTYGYGLIDVKAALFSVSNNFYQNKIETSAKFYNHLGDIRAGEYVDPNNTYNPYIVASGAKIEFKSTSTISLEAGFEVRHEATFLAQVEQQNENCGNWNTFSLKTNKSTENITQTANPLTSKDQTGISNINLYPNPFQNKFTCQFELQSEESIIIQVYNLLGQLVYSMKSEGQKGANKVVIDLESTNRMFVIKIQGINSNFSTVLMKD